jgi:hypothetical protein
MLEATPFRAIRIKTNSGGEYLIEHKENVAIDAGGYEMALYCGEGLAIIELEQVADFVRLPPTPPKPK